MSTEQYMEQMYNSSYYTDYNHKKFFKNVNIDDFLKKYKINTSACKGVKQDKKDEFNEQMKLLHFLFQISTPLNDNKIYNDNYFIDYNNYNMGLIKINSINLVCKRNDLPIHIGSFGDFPHFTLEITTNNSRKNYHLYLNGCLTLNKNQFYSVPIPEQLFDSHIKTLKGDSSNKLRANATPFTPR
jgi:hypothetical protein